jgi:hypothetical protein
MPGARGDTAARRTGQTHNEPVSLFVRAQNAHAPAASEAERAARAASRRGRAHDQRPRRGAETAAARRFSTTDAVTNGAFAALRRSALRQWRLCGARTTDLASLSAPLSSRSRTHSSLSSREAK